MILANNLENAPGAGGVNENVEKLISITRGSNVPVFCCYSKGRLSRVLHRGRSCSICCINDISGIDGDFKSFIASVKSKHESIENRV